jgi:Holliday junction DNA helicase RuvB
MTDLPETKFSKYTRPSLSTFVGQDAIKGNLRPRIEAAKRNAKPLPHLLLCGPSEIGKATLAKSIATEMEVKCSSLETWHFQQVSIFSLEKPGDLAAVLTNLNAGDILLIEEVESLTNAVLEVLIRALEDFQIDVLVGQGQAARLIKLPLKPFCLVATTSRPSQIDKRLRRWLIAFDFAPYSKKEIAEIVCFQAEQQGFVIDYDSAMLLADYCNGSPGDARVLVKRLRDYARPSTASQVRPDAVREALASFGYLDKSLVSVDLIDRLQKMSGLQFEEFVAGLFRKQGYAVEITQGSGDHGIDLLMRKDQQVVAVQCKRWNAPVGESVVRDFLGSIMSVGASLGYIVASSTFTSKAYSFAQEKPIKLIDLDALLEWLPNILKATPRR